MMPSLPELPASFAAALKLIDEAHAEDPRMVTVPGQLSNADGAATTIPYELHYAQRMTRWLAVRCPDASPTLQLACRAQKFRSWETPRSTFPPTRAGYLTWRARQNTQAASQLSALLLSSSSSSGTSIPAADVDRVASLVRKEGLATDPETQALEDVAWLVFLDGQLEGFERHAGGRLGEDKMLRILHKTWDKISPEGGRLALETRMGERAWALVEKALEGYYATTYI
ncbi:hypothetical protein F5X96DRAFT_140040 [Biscogniauxia mediterranea]|nr:hypothetical protein F5X96DRAFT_140040 [Biscogniauxia mediterranea]